MKKDGLMGRMVSAIVQEEKDKAKNKQPDWFMDQKKGLWYMLMNKLDSMEEESESQETAEGESANPENTVGDAAEENAAPESSD